MRILIVDDNPLDSKLIGELCRRRWPDVQLVHDTTGEAGLGRLAGESFDVVLLDYVLPDMNGLTWLKRAGRGALKSPVIMLTWYGDEKIAATAVLKGAAAYVPKEDAADLLTVGIEQVTRHRRAVRRIRDLRVQLHRQSQHRRHIIDSAPMILYTTDRVQKLQFEVQANRLEEHNRRLRDIDAFKTQFLANVSHDLRTPLTVIMAYCEISKDFTDLTPAEQQANLNVIHEQTQRLNRMIGNLLDLSQMEARQHLWDPQEVRPGPQVEKVRQALAPAAQAAELSLTLQVEGDLPCVHADPEGLERVLTNLVENALKFTAEGGVELRVQRWRHQVPLPERMVWGDRPAVLITVEDTGEGMGPEECRRLFSQPEQYRRERKGQGFGLGLAICRRIVSQHGGRIWATTQPGQGSAFHSLWPTEACPTRPGKTRAKEGAR